jgi:hypothetical protein
MPHGISGEGVMGTRTVISAALLLALPALGPAGAETLDAKSLLGRWHSPGVGKCPTAKNPARPRMNPITFHFSGVNAEGMFAGTFNIDCDGPSGNLGGERYVAKLVGNQVVAELNFGGGARKYTYTFTPADGAGEMLTPSGDRVSTAFEHTK